MRNLHNIGLSDLEYAALFYLHDYAPQFGVSLRIVNNVLQCYTERKPLWEAVRKNELDKLFEEWAEKGRPKYPGTIDRA